VSGGSSAGWERLRALCVDLPNALSEGFRSGRELGAGPPAGDRPIYAAGMGGSAIAADLARGLVEDETPASFVIVRGSDLPRAIGPRSWVLLLSYSGETREVLEAYDLAGRRGARRVVISSGGQLAERAETEDVPVLRVPGGSPPRAAVGHLMGGVLGLLDPIFPESNERRLEIAVEQLREQMPRLESARGPAALLAVKVADRLPFVVAERSFGGLARRWRTQLEENAKRIAVSDELPELLHNSVVGWDAVTRSDARRYAIVLLDWTGARPSARRAARYLDRLARARRVRTAHVPLPYEDRLAAICYGLALGDLFSLEIARRDGVDPYPIDAIGRVKAALAAEARESDAA